MISTNDFPANPVPASNGDGENQPPKGGKSKDVAPVPASNGDGENQPPKGGK